MYLNFASQCIVYIEDSFFEMVSFIKASNWKYHIIFKSTQYDIKISAAEENSFVPDRILHPNYEASGAYFVIKDSKGERLGFDFSVFGVASAKIIVERGYDLSFAKEILFDLVRVVLMHKGVACLHASSFVSNDLGNMVIGWEGIGKSAIMLKKVYSGDKFLSDDRTFLDTGGMIHPIYSNVKQYSGEFPFFRELLKKVSFKERLVIKINIWVHGQIKRTKKPRNRLLWQKFLRLLRKLGFYEIEIPLDTLSLGENKGYTLSVVFMLQQIPKNMVSKIHSLDTLRDEIMNKMLLTTKFDDSGLAKLYLVFKYLFPQKKNEAMEEYDAWIIDILKKGLNNCNLHHAAIPHNFSIIDIIKSINE